LEDGIHPKVHKSSTWLKAPNGKASKLTPAQWVTVRTRRFKEWFGDWEVALAKEKIQRLLSSDKDTSGGKKREAIGKVSQRLAADINRLAGIDTSNFDLLVDKSDINHALNRHSNAKIEASRNQIPITESDLLLLPEILNDYDSIEYKGKDKIGRDTFALTKQVNGHYIIHEAVLTGKKVLLFNHFIKRSGASSCLKALLQRPKRLLRPSKVTTFIGRSKFPKSLTKTGSRWWCIMVAPTILPCLTNGFGLPTRATRGTTEQGFIFRPRRGRHRGTAMRFTPFFCRSKIYGKALKTSLGNCSRWRVRRVGEPPVRRSPTPRQTFTLNFITLP